MNNLSQLWVLGAGGHGRVVADAARATRRWAGIVFFDDALAEGASVGGWLVQGSSAEFCACESTGVDRIVAIGDNRHRHDAIGRCKGPPLAVVVHPAAVVSHDAHLGAGTFVAAGAVVGIGADLGEGVIVNTGASVDHDCRLGASVHVGPGARLGGGVMVGDRSWIGLGASVRHQIRIGTDAMVGAGAVVVAAVPDNCVVAGNPARRLRSQPDA
jgi:sugar O-acyltransferase (sialic acid O-acetyltransferase NeuD family)